MHEATDEFGVLLTSGFVKALGPAKTSLSATNYHKLLIQSAEHLARRLEQSVRKCSASHKVTALGAIQLDRDVRALVHFFVNQWCVRSAVARTRGCRTLPAHFTVSLALAPTPHPIGSENGYIIREHFGRLLQLTAILNLDSPEDATVSSTGNLTAEDVRNVLLLRSWPGFDEKRMNGLPLN